MRQANVLDYLMLLRPTLMGPVWIFLFLGYLFGSGEGFLRFTLRLPAKFWWTFFSYSLLMGVVYILNQITDRESDRRNRKLFLIADGIIPLWAAFLYAGVLTVISLGIAWRLGPTLFLLYLLSLLMGALYSVRPFLFKGRPFLDLLSNALGYGLVNFLVGYATAAPLGAEAFKHALPYVLAVGGVFLNTTIPDIPGDQAAGEITTGVKLGPRKTAWLAFLFLLGALIASAWAWDSFCALGSALALPPFGLAALKGGEFFIKLSYRLAGAFFALIVGLRFPPFFFLGLATLLLMRFYYKTRFGLDYPSLTGR